MGGHEEKPDDTRAAARMRRLCRQPEFEDLYGNFDAILWSEQVEKFRNIIKQGQIWLAEGFVRNSFNKKTLTVDNLFLISEVEKQATLLLVNLSEKSKEEINKLKEIISNCSGKTPVQLKITDKSGKASVIKLPETMLITPSESFLRELEKIFGEGNIKLIRL
jgi:DNA polymerase III alpha subunit